MRRQAAAIALTLVVLVLAGCTGSRPSHAAPADPPPPSGLGLRLEPSRVPAGGLVSLSIEGAAAPATSMSVAADFQRWDGRAWRTEYLLDAWGAAAGRPVAVPADELHFIVDIGLVGTQALRLKVPPVEPGEYRIAKEVTWVDRPAQRRVVLYGRLRVVT